MITSEEQLRAVAVRSAAEMMMTAARTAPKACGRDNLELAVVDGAELKLLSDKMRSIAAADDLAFFDRDADCVDRSDAVVLLGSRSRLQGLDCGLCGFPSCSAKTEKAPQTPCVFNVNDLGLAVGSAVSRSADMRVDSRVLYSAGRAASELGLLGDETFMILAVALSVSGKSPYFDRQTNCINR